MIASEVEEHSTNVRYVRVWKREVDDARAPGAAHLAGAMSCRSSRWDREACSPSIKPLTVGSVVPTPPPTTSVQAGQVSKGSAVAQAGDCERGLVDERVRGGRAHGVGPVGRAVDGDEDVGVPRQRDVGVERGGGQVELVQRPADLSDGPRGVGGRADPAARDALAGRAGRGGSGRADRRQEERRLDRCVASRRRLSGSGEHRAQDGVRSPRSARTPGCHAVRGRGRGAGSRACCSRRRRLPHRSPHAPGGPAARGRACRVATCPR